MEATTLFWVLLVALAGITIVSLSVALNHRRHRHRQLSARFGPEYARVIDLTDDRRDAVINLRSPLERGERLHVSALTAAETSAFARRWREVQAEFAASPASGIADAQIFVDGVMRARGYPVDEFEAHADLVSLDHPAVTEHYRAAQAVLLACRAHAVTPEQLRRAELHYNLLVAELLELDTSRP